MRAGFTYGRYALGRRTHGYVVTWRDEGRKRRCYRLGETVEAKARAALIAFATAHTKASAASAVTVGDLMARYLDDRKHDGKSISKQAELLQRRLANQSENGSPHGPEHYCGCKRQSEDVSAFADRESS